uniref:FAD-binding protein n=1 Tax=Volvariella volvacea TaxID=36659 RepID=M9ZBP7_9AGAR|nr:FAD-binding protein [Volvariella volvacea]
MEDREEDVSASIALDVVVVGGGIAGLASAYALQKAGHSVQVLEKTDGKQRGDGGIWYSLYLQTRRALFMLIYSSPPNMTRILKNWGLGPRLEEVGFDCSEITFHEGATGKVIGKIKQDQQFFDELGTPMVTVQHADLYQMMYDIAVDTGVNVCFDTKVIGIDCKTATVILENGVKVKADLIVGADGPQGIVRRALGGEEPQKRQKGYMLLSFTILKSEIEGDEDLRSLVNGQGAHLWVGDEYCANATLIHSNTRFAVMLLYAVKEAASDCKAKFEWTTSHPMSYFELDLQKFKPRLQKLIQLANQVKARVDYLDFEHLENMFGDRCRVALVGEAAHINLPSGGQMTAYSLEDAETLGRLFLCVKLEDRNQVSQTLSAYEDIRECRCTKATPWEWDKRRIMCLPMGQEQEVRDSVWRHRDHLLWGDVDAVAYSGVWEHEFDVFGYDVAAAVEDWWVKWGCLMTQDPGKRVDLKRKEPVAEVVVSVSCSLEDEV